MDYDVSNATVYKCRKCRVFLFQDDYVVNAHGMTVSDVEDVNLTNSDIHISDGCASLTGQGTVWYLRDDKLPNWVVTLIDQGNWIKGKLTCPKCKGRIGSFDYVVGTKCSCGKYVLPAVHVVKGKIDCENARLPSQYVASSIASEKHETESSKEVPTAVT